MDMFLGIAGSTAVFLITFILYVVGAILLSRLVKALFGGRGKNAAIKEQQPPASA